MFINSVQALFFFKLMRTQEENKLEEKTQFELEYELFKKYYLKYNKYGLEDTLSEEVTGGDGIEVVVKDKDCVGEDDNVGKNKNNI